MTAKGPTSTEAVYDALCAHHHAELRAPHPILTQWRPAAGQLLPVQSRYLPGCLYLHDLALIGGELYANAVGLNAVVRLPRGGGFEPVWWPRCIDTENGPRMDRNYLQLNSIAPGPTLKR